MLEQLQYIYIPGHRNGTNELGTIGRARLIPLFEAVPLNRHALLLADLKIVDSRFPLLGAVGTTDNITVQLFYWRSNLKLLHVKGVKIVF